jgi:uroporphyrinogen III methyltransferase/synthase
VLLTGADTGELACRLRGEGAEPIEIPTIEIRAAGEAEMDEAIRRFGLYDWVVLTSANGVRALLGRFAEMNQTVPVGPRWAAVGPKTNAALEARGIEVAFVPPEETGSAIPSGMGDLEGRSVLLPRARRATPDLPDLLREQGARVHEVTAYETVEGPAESRPRLLRELARGVEAIVFTSGSTVRGLVSLLGEKTGELDLVSIVCIGPVTGRAAEEAGLRPTAIAEQRSPEGVVTALLSCKEYIDA